MKQKWYKNENKYLMLLQWMLHENMDTSIYDCFTM